MTATELNSLHGCVLSDEKSADTFGPENFVGTERIEVDAEAGEIHRNFAKGLNAVGMEVDRLAVGTACGDEACDLGNGLNRAGFVVGVHDGDEASVVAQSTADRVGWFDISNGDAFLFELAKGLQRRRGVRSPG